MIKKIIIASICLFAATVSHAIDMSQVRFHDEASDTTRLNEMLANIASQKLVSPGDRVVAAGRQFLATPYVANTLEGDPEMLTVDLDELDCTTFMETAVALALTVGEKRNSWRDFVYNLERLRYRNGTINGYPSRLHYISDWVASNRSKGLIKDVTPEFEKCSYAVKTLDFMSTNADKYPALADSANLAAIKSVEMGYRSHRFPYIKSNDVGAKSTRDELRNGDIVALILKDKSLDAGHVGIIVKEKGGEPMLMHASSAAGKVVITETPLVEYLKKNHNYIGIRVMRLEE
ncbi:MAG: DUF1460 domain-containing protein [Bacteroidales bacterium]|nr:DUF1460 domain-containing protein [Bacteroidales bacterium]